MTTWIEDANGNKCSVEWFGSREAAQAALDSLKECVNCFDCSGCSRCSRCSRCLDCSDCFNSSGCSYCSYCWSCSRCSGCSDCSGCSRCSDCSHVAFVCDKRRLQGNPRTSDAPGPAIPTIEDIHAKVFAAASQPQALDMGTWHTCNTTHCRAGWVVHLAGEPGYALEHFYGTALAAQLIYRESDPQNPVSPVRFFETTDQAMADMRRLAKVAE
jgi:hypothetical protein